MNNQVVADFTPLKTRGSIKWFSDEKGFGFILCEGIGVDVFIHSQQIQKSGTEPLKEGDKISCTVNKGVKGLYATEIKKLEDK